MLTTMHHGVMINRAFKLMCDAHLGQLDKGGQPYFHHPVRVAFSIPNGYDWRYVATALLHDVVKDAGTYYANLHHDFGGEVTDAIAAVTRRKDEVYKDFIHRAASHPIGRVVKWFDLLDNMSPERATNPELEERIKTRYGPARRTISQSFTPNDRLQCL